MLYKVCVLFCLISILFHHSLYSCNLFARESPVSRKYKVGIADIIVPILLWCICILIALQQLNHWITESMTHYHSSTAIIIFVSQISNREQHYNNNKIFKNGYLWQGQEQACKMYIVNNISGFSNASYISTNMKK